MYVTKTNEKKRETMNEIEQGGVYGEFGGRTGRGKCRNYVINLQN